MKVIDKNLLANIVGGSEATDNLTIAGAIGAGYGASRYLTRVGGFTALSESATLTFGAASVAGVLASGYVGFQAGSYAYNNSQTVRDVAGAAFDFGGSLGGRFFDFMSGVSSFFSQGCGVAGSFGRYYKHSL